MVLNCEIGIAEGKPLMEQYGLDELAASADAVVPGLGVLVAGLAGLVAGLTGAGAAGLSFEEIGERVMTPGRGARQEVGPHVVDAQAGAGAGALAGAHAPG